MLDNNVVPNDAAPSLRQAGTRPACLAPAAYHSFAFAAREDAAIWTLDWVCIGTGADIAQPGDMLPYTVGDHAVHVQRAADGGIDGRFNQAQHGGCRSVPLQCRQGVKTPCSFTSCGHSLDRMPLSASELGAATPAMHQYLGLRPERLLPVRTAALGPLLFVNLNPLGEAFDATSLELEQALPMLADRCWTRTGHAWLEYAGNWKLVGQSLAACAEPGARGAGIPSARGRALSVRRQGVGSIAALWGFPNLVVLAWAGSLCVVVLQPVASNRTRCRVSIFSADGEPASVPWMQILHERRPPIEDAQRAMQDWGRASEAQADSLPFADAAVGAWIGAMVATRLERIAHMAPVAAPEKHIHIRSMQ
jgi:hypothetical protein